MRSSLHSIRSSADLRANLSVPIQWLLCSSESAHKPSHRNTLFRKTETIPSLTNRCFYVHPGANTQIQGFKSRRPHHEIHQQDVLPEFHTDSNSENTRKKRLLAQRPPRQSLSGQAWQEAAASVLWLFSQIGSVVFIVLMESVKTTLGSFQYSIIVLVVLDLVAAGLCSRITETGRKLQSAAHQ